MICVVIQGPCHPSSMSPVGSRFDGSGLLTADLQHATSLEKFLKKSFTCSGRYPIMNSRAEAQPIGAVSSGVEHYLDTVGVTSSNLVSPTKNDKTEEVFLLGLFYRIALSAMPQRAWTRSSPRLRSGHGQNTTSGFDGGLCRSSSRLWLSYGTFYFHVLVCRAQSCRWGLRLSSRSLKT